MSTPTYTLINQVTLATTSATVTFSSIPQSYVDLVLVVEGTLSVFDGVGVTFNGDASAAYPTVVMFAGTSPGSINYTGNEAAAGVLSTSRGNIVCSVFDYSAIDKHKTVVGRSGVADTQVRTTASRWTNTASINRMSVNAAAGTRTFGVGTTFSLYGIVG